MVDAAGRVRAGGADRRAHRLGAERRLARRRLNVVAGVEVLRRLAEEGEPPVDGAAGQLGRRGGRALRALAVRLERRPRARWRDQDELRQLTRRRRRRAAGRARGARRRPRPRDSRRARQLENAAAYLELHIEQGPVLESHGPAARRRARHVRRRAPPDHVPRPGGARGLDADGQAPRRARRRREARARDPRDREARPATAPSARWAASSRSPGIVTSVVETAECLLDQRHLDAAQLAEMLSNAEAASRRFAQEENIEVEWERIWNIEPILFDEALIELADESIREVAGTSHRLPSGPLHDAAEVARAGVPTVMLFVQSLRGLSHTKLEDTKEEHLELSVQALDRLADKTIARISAGSESSDARTRMLSVRRDRAARSAVLAAGRADAARRAQRLRVRLDLRLAHPLAGVATRCSRSPATKTETDQARPLRHEPGHPRPDDHRELVRDDAGHLRRPDGDGHRPRRLVAPRRRPEAGQGRRVRAAPA